jgi:imidazoleglycerol phosphate dehydratase HisB
MTALLADLLMVVLGGRHARATKQRSSALGNNLTAALSFLYLAAGVATGAHLKYQVKEDDHHEWDAHQPHNDASHFILRLGQAHTPWTMNRRAAKRFLVLILPLDNTQHRAPAPADPRSRPRLFVEATERQNMGTCGLGGGSPTLQTGRGDGAYIRVTGEIRRRA